MIRVVHISDWHSRAELFERRLEHEASDVPHDPDLVLVTGDMLVENDALPREYRGREQEPHLGALVDALEARWPATDIVAVRGNHDWLDYGIDSRVVELGRDRLSYAWKDQLISGVRGMPRWVGSWNDELSEDQIHRTCSSVDPATTILISHTPPYGILDDSRDSPRGWRDMPNHPGPRRLGSHALRRLANGLPALRAHCFGHIHEQGGRSHTSRGVRLSNAALTLNYFELG